MPRVSVSLRLNTYLSAWLGDSRVKRRKCCLYRGSMWETQLPFSAFGLGRDYNPATGLSAQTATHHADGSVSWEIPMKDLQGSPCGGPAFTGRVLNLARLQHPTVYPPAIHPFSLRKERFTFYSSLYSPVYKAHSQSLNFDPQNTI